MPPRKSDPASRKSDVSTSRFVLNDDEVQPESMSVPPPAAAAGSSTDAALTSPPPPAQAPAQSSEKKDKEKEPVTIEVRGVLFPDSS